MKYRIYWVDDTTTWVKSNIAQVNDIFSENQFIPEINTFTDIKTAKTTILDNYLDLLIIDFTLPDGETGDSLINYLRASRCFAHILFYSQDISKINIPEDKHFIHTSHRDDVTERLSIIADQAYRSYRHPAFMRGLLLSEFIDLENLMEDVIVNCFRQEGAYFRESVISKGGEGFSFSTKLSFIRRLIKDAEVKSSSLKQSLDSIDLTAQKFQEKILERRNILAHAYPEYNKTDGKILLKSSKPTVTFDESWFHDTREYIHQYKNKLKEINKLNLIDHVNPAISSRVPKEVATG